MEYLTDDIGNVAPETCEWLLQKRVYRSWLSRAGAILCLKGNPGAGKSTLLRYILHSVKKTHGIGNSVFLMFDCARSSGACGGEFKTESDALFRSLLYQLLDQAPDAMADLITTFQKRYEVEGEPCQLRSEELQYFFESSLPKLLKSRSVWLFIDALYDCRQSADDLAKKFKWLSRRLWSTGNLKPFHSCFTSRHYPDLDFDNKSTILLDGENKLDIATFVKHSLPKSYLSLEVDQLIIDRAQGFFLWARLALDMIRHLLIEKASPAKIEAALEEMPADINSLYALILKTTENPTATKSLMEWICFSTRPLTTDELRWAMAFDAKSCYKSFSQYENSPDFINSQIFEPRIIALSCGLVEIVSHGNRRVVQFIHASVRDFLVDSGLSELCSRANASNNATPEINVVGTAHCRLSRSCVRYFQTFSRSSRPSKVAKARFPLLHYATTSWIKHAQQGDVAEIDACQLVGMLKDPLIKSWGEMYQMIDPAAHDCPSAAPDLVHLASKYGLTKIVSWLLENAHIVDMKDMHGQTPLSHAAENGQEAVVSLLLDTGRVDINSRSKSGYTPLSYAAMNGHVGVVRLLLAVKNVDVDSEDNYNYTPLSRATEKGHVDVTNLLLNTNKVRVDARDTVYGQTPLMRAARKGYSYVVDLLLGTKKVDVDARDKVGRTALRQAAEEGHVTVTRQLLSTNQVDANARDNVCGQTPLARAAWNGHVDVVELLINTKSVHLDARDNSGQTPLSLAAENGNEAVVKRLLSTGNVNVNSKDTTSQTPLSYAAENGNVDLMRTFFRTANVHFDSKDEHGQTALSRASKNGHEALVKLLLKTRQFFVVGNESNGDPPAASASGDGRAELENKLLDVNSSYGSYLFENHEADTATTMVSATMTCIPTQPVSQELSRATNTSIAGISVSENETQGFEGSVPATGIESLFVPDGTCLTKTISQTMQSVTDSSSSCCGSSCRSLSPSIAPKSARRQVIIYDPRWHFPDKWYLPSPRYFCPTRRNYRLGRVSSVPLPLHFYKGERQNSWSWVEA